MLLSELFKKKSELEEERTGLRIDLANYFMQDRMDFEKSRDLKRRISNLSLDIKVLEYEIQRVSQLKTFKF